MNTKDVPKSWYHAFSWRDILHLAVPFGFLLLMLALFPFRERFEFDPDEGINAIKGLLLARGYPLYSEIWSDQPPLFTYLIAATIRAFGHDINALRTLVLLLSSMLLGSAYFFLRLTWSIWHALAGVLLLLLLPFYKTLSVSVMIGLPAIAFAGLSLLALTIWHQRHANVWLVLSAAALSLSILTKLFTGFLAPIFFVGILIDQKARLDETLTWPKLLRPAIIWGLVFAAITIGLGLILVGPANLGQLLGTHLTARSASLYIYVTKTYPLAWHLSESWAILLLALIGSIFTLLNRNWLSLYLVAWAIAGYLLLSFQVPVRYHHQLLITIPIAMLAGIAVGETVILLPEIIRKRHFFNLRGFLSAATITAFTLTLVTLAHQAYLDFRLPAHLLEPAAQEPGREQPFIDELTKWGPGTQWIVTDLPIYAFRVGLSVPPPLAVTSEKRLETGELTEEQIIAIVDEYRPEQVLIGRFKLPALEDFLRDDYRRNRFWGRKHLYLLGELKRNP
jgi:hypothetical protein